MVREYDGELPATYAGWIQLPGVGPYIAGAVLSIAYHQPFPAVDGNVLRVIARIDGIREDIAQPSVRRKTADRVAEMMPREHAGDFTQALMEMGALVCTPADPDCKNCPVRGACAAYRQGEVGQIPFKKPKARPRPVKLWVIAAQTEHSILLEYRRHYNLLGNMWGLPVFEQKKGDKPETLAYHKYLLHLQEGRHIGHVSHTFTHQRWEMDVIGYHLPGETDTKGELEWVSREQLAGKPIPVAFQKVLTIIND